jgi:hypothetical protein
VGEYRATTLITSGPIGACPLVLTLDNGANSFLDVGSAGESGAIALPLLTATVNAVVQPIRILVPPSNPTAPGCGQVFLPLTFR